MAGHVRRVKCVRRERSSRFRRIGSDVDHLHRRLNAEEPSCEACLKRNIRCTSYRNDGLRNKQRGGRNLEAVTTTFGTSTPESASSSSPVTLTSSRAQIGYGGTRPSLAFGPGALSTTSRSLERPYNRSLSADSAESRLNRAEESESLMAGMLDSYFRSSTFSVPIVHWAKLQELFELAGRRPKQMDIMIQVCLSALSPALMSDRL